MEDLRKEFVPPVESLELAKLNFNERCFGYYGVDNELVIEISCNLDNNLTRRNFFAAPLYQQAFKFVLGIIENDRKLKRKFRDRYFLNFSSVCFQMDDRELSATYESDEETLGKIISFIHTNK